MHYQMCIGNSGMNCFNSSYGKNIACWRSAEFVRSVAGSYSNRQSLDTALEKLNRCCADQQLSARDIAQRLDEVSRQSLFLPLFEEVSRSNTVPNFESLFEQLGVDISGAQLQLRNSAEQLAIREGIGRQM